MCFPLSCILRFIDRLLLFICYIMSVSFATPLTVAHQAPLSKRFPKQEYWNGLPFPSPGDLPGPGIEPRSPASADRFFTCWAPREASWQGWLETSYPLCCLWILRELTRGLWQFLVKAELEIQTPLYVSLTNLGLQSRGEIGRMGGQALLASGSHSSWARECPVLPGCDGLGKDIFLSFIMWYA